MKTACDYLDAVSARLGGVSDYRIAMTLGITPQSVCNWRKGRDTIGEENAHKIAQILGIDPTEILLLGYAAKSKNALTRAALENAIRKLGGMAACLALSVFALFSSSDVSAETMPSAKLQAANALYYVKSIWLAKIRALRQLGRFFTGYAFRHGFARFSGFMPPV